MTSRITPVGILVVALASLVAVGCSAPTDAVFQALLYPAGTTAPAAEVEPVESAAESGDDSTWWQHPSGYEMVLPAGWAGVAVEPDATDDLIDAVDESDPGLGERIDEVIGESDVQISAIAANGVIEGKVAPVLLVLAEPVAGRKNHVIKDDVHARLNDLPGLNGGLAPHDVRLPKAKGVRYDYTISDPALGEIRVRSYLFRWGQTVYLVNFVASADLADEAAPDFDSIQDSLQFGA